MKEKLVFDKIPTKENGRNSEGSFLRAPNGDILFAYSRFSKSDWIDDAPCDIAMIRSSDEGETWSEPVVLARAQQFGVENIMSVSGLYLKDGGLCFFFVIKEKDNTSNIGRLISSDGVHFTASRCQSCFLPSYYVINNDRFIRLKDGRIVVPTACHRTGPSAPDGSYASFVLEEGRAMVLVSEDDGASFDRLPAQAELSVRANMNVGLQEPGLMEMPGGYYWMWARTALGRQYQCFSLDGLQTFTPPEPSDFTSPCSPMQVIKDEDTLYAVYNPVPHANSWVNTYGAGDRTPFALQKSTDFGRSWGPVNLIEDDPARGYCYPAVFVTRDNCLLIAYCRGGIPDSGCCLNRLGIMKIEKDSIL